MTEIGQRLRQFGERRFLTMAEFLMPEVEIRPYLTKINIEVLANLKRYWKVSMQAILMRANTLKMITQNQYRYLWTEMSKMGYKKNEPIEIPQEQPTLLREVVNVYLKDYEYSDNELKALLYLDDEEYKKYNPHAITPLRILPRVHKLHLKQNRRSSID
jgi:hypothetical protein